MWNDRFDTLDACTSSLTDTSPDISPSPVPPPHHPPSPRFCTTARCSLSLRDRSRQRFTVTRTSRRRYCFSSWGGSRENCRTACASEGTSTSASWVSVWGPGGGGGRGRAGMACTHFVLDRSRMTTHPCIPTCWDGGRRVFTDQAGVPPPKA